MKRRRGHPPPPWTALLGLLAAQTLARHGARAQAVGPGPNGVIDPARVAGHAYYDSVPDGIKDPMNPLDYGIYDIAVFLFTCGDGAGGDVNLVRTANTDAVGRYEFGDLAAGQYYVNVPTVPSWYRFTEVWAGAVDRDTGEPLYPLAESAVDPATGSTDCFAIGEGEERSVDFGMVFDTGPPPAPLPSASPVKTPTFAPLAAGTTRSPSAATLSPPSGAPSPAPTATVRPSGTPTAPPSRDGVWVGPTVTDRLVMTITGVSALENEESWRNITEEHVADYYVVNDDAGVWNTEVDIEIVNVADVSTDGDNILTFPEQAVEVVYTQTSYYKTADPELLDDVYVASQPFQTVQGVEAYIAALRQLSRYYDGVTDVTLAFSPPTVPPTVAPSTMPSADPTASAPPTVAPTPSPSRSGVEEGPVVTERLRMTIRGIERLEDEAAWSLRTAEHVMDYFVVNDDEGVWDVAAEIAVVRQESSNPAIGTIASESGGTFDRRRRGRGLQEEATFVEVTYNQRSAYKTNDPETYDDVYVATRPFATREGVEAYVASLRSLSPYYDDVVSVGSVQVLGPAPAPGPVEGGEEGSGDNTLWIIVGAACGGAVLVAALAFFAYRRRHKRRGAESVSDSDVSGDLESGSSESSDFRTVEVFSDKGSQKGTPEKRTSSDSDENGGMMAAAAAVPTGPEVKIDVIAPAGKLGVIVDTPPGGGAAYVCEIKDLSPLRGKIRLEDKIVAVDDEDVRGMTAVDVSKLLARRSKNPQRKITVLRRDEGGEDDGSEGSAEGSEGSGPSAAAAATAAGAATAAAAATAALNKDEEEGDDGEESLVVVAPAGKLGVVLVTPEPPAHGPAYVFNIRDDSPLQGKVKLGDKIVAVDDQDVRTMTAINVSKLLGSKSSHAERRIRVLRESGDDDDDGELERAASAESSPSRSIAAAAAAVSTPDLSGAGTSSSSPENKASSLRSMAAHPPKAATPPAPAAKKAPARPPSPVGEKMVIIAPAGKLGVVVDSPPEGGSAYVSDVKVDSPIFGQIKMGDRILSVDDEDVSKLKAIHVSMLLGSKSRNKERKLTVLRPADSDSDTDGE
ncbi:hypothetical protein ACHAXT_011415 [Thalassiosira profunda]